MNTFVGDWVLFLALRFSYPSLKRGWDIRHSLVISYLSDQQAVDSRTQNRFPAGDCAEGHAKLLCRMSQKCVCVPIRVLYSCINGSFFVLIYFIYTCNVYIHMYKKPQGLHKPMHRLPPSSLHPIPQLPAALRAIVGPELGCVVQGRLAIAVASQVRRRKPGVQRSRKHFSQSSISISVEPDNYAGVNQNILKNPQRVLTPQRVFKRYMGYHQGTSI